MSSITRIHHGDEAGAGAVYGLTRPTMADALDALIVVYRNRFRAERTLDSMLRPLGLTRRDARPVAFDQLTVAMLDSDDPVVTLCGRSLLIRRVSYDRLRAARDHVVAGQSMESVSV